MSNDQVALTLVNQVADQLGKIFRHMLPGLTILFAAAAAHPSWLKREYFSTPWNLAIFAAIAVIAGNTWYVFHRYSLHQAIDWAIYMLKRRTADGYIKWLANHLYRTFHTRAEDRKLQEFVMLRSAQVIFMFITCEVALLFSWGAEQHTFYYTHSRSIALTAVGGLAVATLQYFISNNLDLHIAERYRSEK